MDTYLASLFDSELPFDPWVAALTWLVLFVANQGCARSARAAHDAQKFISVEDWGALRRGFEPKYMLAQLLLASGVFVFGFFLGRPAFAFFAGGLIVAKTCALSLNVQSIFSARALAVSGAAEGSVTLSTALALRQAAQRLGCSALACLLMGLVVLHLALLGGALILASGAWGFLRRAGKERAQS